MKQLVQDYRTGELALRDVPPPQLRKGGVLVRTRYSLVSAGTERGQIEFARKSLIMKGLARPDLVAKVLAKARTEGPLAALQKALRRLEQPLALGYSCAGIVDSVSDDVRDIAPGDLVACAGLGFASHAQMTFVPRNLCVRVPPGVDPAEAAYVTVGAIAIEGTRVAEVRLGESVAVVGLGLLGLLTAQVLKAGGCRVFGIDPDPVKTGLARECGADVALLRNAEDLEQQVLAFTSGSGVDAVIVTAATASSDPLELAATVARDRACVVVVGITGMKLPRKAFYEKALELRMSRGYGPGRYDRSYEEKGIDYPIGYVRWTENRNMQAFLQLLTDRRMDVRRLTTHTFPIEHALEAYDLIVGQKERHVGVLLEYGQDTSIASRVAIAPRSKKPARIGTPRVGVIGAGAFATGILVPALLKSGVRLRGIVTQTGLTAERAAARFGFEYCASDPHEVLDDEETDAVVIVTRPDSHAELAVGALERGKDVFIEKPLSTELEDLRKVWAAFRGAADAHLMVGFNRRYAQFGLKLREFFAPHAGTLMMTYRVNATSMARDNWQLDQEQGGGRLIAECGHFIDLMGFVSGESPTHVSATAAAGEDVAVTVRFDRGSVGSLTYTASGSEAFPKERLEVFGDGRVGVLDDFRRLELVVGGRSQRFANRLGQDKGHEGEMRAFAAALRGQADAVPHGTAAVLTTLATLQAALSLRTGLRQPVALSLLD